MSSGKIGGKIVLEGASKYNSDLKNIKSSLAELKSEMRLASTQYATTANSVEALTKKQEIYGKQIEQVTKKVDTYAKMLEDAQKAQEKAGKQVDEYSKELEEAKKKLDDMQKSGDASNEELEQQEKVISDLTGKLEGANKAYETAGHKIQQYSTAGNNAKAELANLNRELDQNDKYLDEAKNSTDGCAKSIDEYGREVDDAGEKTSRFGDIVKGSLAADVLKAGIKALCDGIKDAATAAVEAGAQFEAGMDKVAAISGATAQEMEQLTAKAEEMGAKTMFSASESADALSYMAMAGWDTKAMLEGIEPVMSLAAASGSDLATVSDILTDDLTAFGMSADEAGHFADVLAAASANANTNVELLGETFKYAAPVAGALGYSLEDISVAAGLMANSGIKASSAGTALRSIMTRLAKPTKDSAKAMEDLGISLTDNDGKMYSFMEIMEQMRDRFSGLTEAEKAQSAAMLAGKNAMSGLLAIVNSSDEDFERLTKAIDESEGAAKQMADTMQDNLKGKVTILQSALEGLGIATEKVFDEDMKTAVKGATDAVDRLHDSISNGDLGVSLGKMSDALGDFLQRAIDAGEKALPVMIDGLTWLLDNSEKVIGALTGMMAAKVIFEAVEAWKAYKTATETAKAAQVLLNGAMASNPAGLLAIAVGTLVGLVGAYTLTAKDAADATGELVEQAQKNKEASERLAESHRVEAEQLQKARDTIRELSKEEELSEEQKAQLRIAVETLQGSLGDLGIEIDNETGKIKGNTDAILDNVDALLEQYKLTQKQEELQQLIKDMAETEEAIAEAEKKLSEEHEKATQRQDELNNSIQTFFGLLENPEGMEYYSGHLVEIDRTSKKVEEDIDSLNQTLDEQKAKAEELATEINESSASIQEDTSGIAEAYDQVGEAANNMVNLSAEAWAALTEEEQKALEDMIGKVEEFDGLFEQMNTKTKATADDMATNLKNNADAMNDYADNVEKAVELAQNAKGDSAEATRAIVEHLIGLGIDGAAELAEFVRASEEDSAAFNEILSNWGKLDEAKTSVEEKIREFGETYATGYDSIITETSNKNTEYTNLQSGFYTQTEADLTTHSNEMVKIQQEASTAYEQAIRDGTPQITDAVSEQIEAMKDAIQEGLDYDGTTVGYFKDLGTNQDQSWADAIADNQDKVITADEELVDELIRSTESSLQISGDHCGVSDGWGSAITSSLAQSIRSGSGEVAAAVHELCEEACNSFDLSPLVNRIEGLIADGVGRAEAAIGGIMSSYGI